MATASKLQPADEARMWRSQELGGLELLQASFSEFAFTPHTHGEFMIAVTESGLAKPIYRRDSHAVGPGDIIVLNPEEPHAGGPAADTPWQYRGFYPSLQLMGQIAQEFPADGIFPEFAQDIVRDAKVAAKLRRFHVLSERPDVSMLERETLLTDALVLLVARHGTRRRDPRSAGRETMAVVTARAYLDEHAEKDTTLASLAALAGISPFHLCRVFRRDVGLTPHGYATQIRVRRAKVLLRTGMPIAAVAAEAGFYDQAHLNRHFKRIVGVTPGQYARASGG